MEVVGGLFTLTTRMVFIEIESLLNRSIMKWQVEQTVERYKLFEKKKQQLLKCASYRWDRALFISQY